MTLRAFSGLALLTLSLAGPAAAAITYIDADEVTGGNTVGLPGGWTARGLGAGQAGNNFANNGGALQGQGTADLSELATTVSVPNGVYEIHVFFWDDTPSADVSLSWNIQAGFTSGSLTSFTNASPGVFAVNAASQAAASTEILGLNVLGDGADTYADYIDGNRVLFAAPLGQVTVTGGSFTVFIDHQTAAVQRTWYDGVGYTAVPEPSAGALGLLALLGVAARRRTS